MLGPGEKNAKDAKVLNRIVLASVGGYTCEADARHPESVAKNIHLQNAKSVSSPELDTPQEGE